MKYLLYYLILSICYFLPPTICNAQLVKEYWKQPIGTKNLSPRVDAALADAMRSRIGIASSYQYLSPYTNQIVTVNVSGELLTLAKKVKDTSFPSDKTWSAFELDLMEYFVSGPGKDVPLVIGADERPNSGTSQVVFTFSSGYPAFAGESRLENDPARLYKGVHFGVSISDLPEAIRGTRKNHSNLNSSLELFKSAASMFIDAEQLGYQDKGEVKSLPNIREYYRIFRRNLWALNGNLPLAFVHTEKFFGVSDGVYNFALKSFLTQVPDFLNLASSPDYPYLVYQVVERFCQDYPSLLVPDYAKLKQVAEEVLTEYGIYLRNPALPDPEQVSPERIMADTIIKAPAVIPLIVTDKELDSYRMSTIYNAVQNADDLENDAAMYLLTHLNLTDVTVSRVLRTDLSSSFPTSIMLASAGGAFTSSSHGPQTTHFPSMLNNGGGRWLLFVSEVKQASEVGAIDPLNAQKHLNSLVSRGVLRDKLYTIHKQQSRFLLSANPIFGLSLPDAIADDINAIYTILRPKLLPLKATDRLNADDEKTFFYQLKTRQGREVANILFQQWRPGLSISSSSASSSSAAQVTY